jgi:hypothetical protein
MKTTSFSIEGSLRSDGLVRFSSDDLPGFRLLLKARDDPAEYSRELHAALKEFVPLFLAADSRH